MFHICDIKQERPCLVKPEIMSDEYDPERPYQGKPDLKMTGKIPFTGYFDPLQQQYTIENFDSNTFQTREGVEPSIILPDKPNYIKRLEAIPFSGDPAKREAEISDYLKNNHNVTYALLQNPNGLMGQISWQMPPPITVDSKPKPVKQLATSTIGKAISESAAQSSKASSLITTNPGYRTTVGVPAVNSDKPKDPRLNKATVAKANILANVYKTNMPITKAASTITVRPIELAAKPVHKPSMERVNRHVQLAQRANTARVATPKPSLPAWEKLQGQFCKAKPDKKPKGSRNVPLSLAKMTDVPASCWPLVEAQEAAMNMWTNPHTPPPSPPKGELDALKQLAVPVSPLAESVNNDQVPSFPVEENLTKSSLEIQISTRAHVAKLPGVTLTPVKLNRKVPAPKVAKLNANNSDYLKSRATITQVNRPAKALTMSDNDSMDLDSTFIAAGEKRASETDSDAPKAKKTTMQALAYAYQNRVVETKNKLVLKKGGGPINPLPSLEGNVETEFFNEVVKVSDKPVAKPSYAAAPLLTLRPISCPKG